KPLHKSQIYCLRPSSNTSLSVFINSNISSRLIVWHAFTPDGCLRYLPEKKDYKPRHCSPAYWAGSRRGSRAFDFPPLGGILRRRLSRCARADRSNKSSDPIPGSRFSRSWLETNNTRLRLLIP